MFFEDDLSFINEEKRCFFQDINGSEHKIMEGYLWAWLVTANPEFKNPVTIYHWAQSPVSGNIEADEDSVHLMPVHGGYEFKDEISEVDNFRAFFKRGVARLYKNDEKRVSVITYTSEVSIKRLVATLPMWVSWGDKPTIPDALAPVAAMLQANASDEDIFRSFETIFLESDIKEKYFRKMISKLPTFYEKIVNERAESELRYIQNNIEQHMADLRVLRERQMALQMQVIGGRNIVEEIDCGEHLWKYLEKNPSIKLLEVREGALKVGVSEPLKFWDEMLLQRLIQKETSILYVGYPPDAAEGIKRFWSAVNDGEAQILLTGVFGLQYEGRVYVERFMEWPDKKGYPNPHLKIHGCVGENGQAIEKNLQWGHIIAALEQCRVSAGSINFAEGPTSRPFFESFINSDTPCVSVHKGELVTPAEAIKILERGAENGT